MCTFNSESAKEYQKHLLRAHNSYSCSETGCMKLFGSEKLLYRHLYLDHWEDSKVLTGKQLNTHTKTEITQESKDFILNRRKPEGDLFNRRDSLMFKGRKIAISFIKNIKKLIIESGINEFSIPLDPRANELHWAPGRCPVSEYQVASVAMLLLFSVARTEPSLPFKRSRPGSTLSDLFSSFNSKSSTLENQDPSLCYKSSYKCTICDEHFVFLHDLQGHFASKHC